MIKKKKTSRFLKYYYRFFPNGLISRGLIWNQSDHGETDAGGHFDVPAMYLKTFGLCVRATAVFRYPIKYKFFFVSYSTGVEKKQKPFVLHLLNPSASAGARKKKIVGRTRENVTYIEFCDSNVSRVDFRRGKF